LNRLNEAISAFEKVAEDEDATFRKDAFFDMANAYQRQGELALAQAAYDDYFSLAKSEAKDNPAQFDQVSLRIAKAKLGLASTADDRSQSDDATALYGDVDEILQPIADNPQSSLRDEALFNQALAAIGLGDRKKSAAIFEKIAAMPDSKLARQSAVLAGRELSALGQHDRAIEILRPIAESNSRFGVEAAILLSAAWRVTDQPELAKRITDHWANAAPKSPLIVPLMMEQADAAFLIPGQKKQAAEIYSKIALDYPQSSATPAALYKSAAAHWETFESDDAVKMANQFIKLFPKHPRVPSARSILADAEIAKENFAEGESYYRDLLADYPSNPDVSRWTLRIGWTLFLQDKFAESRDFLKQRIDTISRPQDQSEAYHWIGESEYELKNYRDATSALNQSLESETPWDRLDATLFTRMQAEIALGQSDDALETLGLLQSALLRTGEAYLDQQKFPEAISQYKKVISQFPESSFLPSAMYGLGWAQLRSGQFETAEATFDKLIADFPTTNLAQKARAGRSIAQRRLGKTDSAIANLIELVKTAPEGEQKNNSMMELGLAYVENEDWPTAEATFNQLLAVEPKTSLADRAHYELAWVLKALKKPKEALVQFQQLVDDHPNSDLAAEAYFEVAADLYQREEYQSAADMFRLSLESISSDDISKKETKDDVSLGEKAMYKLAWSRYQLKEFEAAAEIFEAVAVAYPQSNRVGNALFMLAQSNFQLDKFREALSAYQSAKEKLKAAPFDNAPQKRLLLLHGAQSANQIGEYQTAVDLATPLTTIETDGDTSPESVVAYTAWLEIAKARFALEQVEGAMDALERASKDLGRTGAQARVMKGDLLLEQNNFDDAINEYKLVFYGYGGTKSTGEVRALQAYAIYEAARASYIRVADASARMKPVLIQQALEHFRYLVENYADQPLAEKATQQITTLEKLQQEQ